MPQRLGFRVVKPYSLEFRVVKPYILGLDALKKQLILQPPKNLNISVAFSCCGAVSAVAGLALVGILVGARRSACSVTTATKASP